MLGVVHGDHRPEELGHLHRQILDVAACAADEQLRVATGEPHVFVTHERPIAGPHRERRVLERTLLVEVQPGRLAQRPERAFAVVAWGGPELRIGEVERVGIDGGVDQGSDVCHETTVPVLSHLVSHRG